MKQNSPKYYKVYTAADGRVCIASVEFAADFGANAPDNCPCMGYIKVMHGNKRAEAPCYLMPAKMAKLLKPEEYRPAPTGGSTPAAPKSRPDAATMALYWLLTEAAAFADAEPQRVFENGQYKLIAKEAPDMLKRLKREFNITKTDLKTYPPTVAPAPVQDQQQPEPAAAPVADAAAVVFTDSMDDAIEARTAEAVELPAWAVDGVRCVYDSRDDGKLTGTADRFHWSAVGHCWLCDFTDGRASIIGALVERMTPEPVQDQQPDTDDPAAVDAHFADLAAHDTPASEKTEPAPANQKTAATDADVLATAARIRANYEAMQADIEAEREQTAAAFAEAITAYCEELEQPAPLAWEPETIIIPFEPRPAAEVEQPRRRHRLNLRPRLSRWLHPARWVAVAFAVCLLSGLLLGMNTSTAADAAADAETVAQVVDLPAVTVTAEAPDTFIEDKAPSLIEDKAPCLIEDKAPAPAPVKKLAAPSPVKNATADAVTLHGQKTADDMATATAPSADDADSLTTAPAAPLAPATDSDGLTICAGTAWAYTMMNWA